MHQDIREPHYTLPCFLPQWCRIKDALRNIKESTSDTQLLVSALQNAYNLTHHDFLGGCPRDGPEDNLFTGLGKFLEKDLSLEEKVNFQEVVIPCIVDRVMEMETIGPLEGLSICLPQKEVSVELNRPLVASFVACGFLCLFPKCRHSTTHYHLQSINFDQFFCHLDSLLQIAKLKCILHYFEKIAEDPGGPVGKIIIKRQVTPISQIPSLDDWLSCDLPLCQLDVVCERGIENAGSKFIQVNFADEAIGGAVLEKGYGQEELRFCLCPELLAAKLIMSEMRSNEAVLVQGFETFSKCCKINDQLHCLGPLQDSAERNSLGNLESTLCAIDAMDFSSAESTEQYKRKSLLRELNKAFTGFQQRSLQPAAAPSTEDEEEEMEGERKMRAKSEEYFSADDGTPLEGAVAWSPEQVKPEPESESTSQESPMATSEETTSSSSSTQSYPRVPHSLRRKSYKELPSPSSKLPKQQSQSSSSSEVSDSPRSSRFKPQKQLSQTLPAVTLPWQSSLQKQDSEDSSMDLYDRRRSSNLSDVVSRRSSSDSSRRSSSKRSSSEFSSEFEEYYESFQRQERKLKPIAIEEEAPAGSLHDFAEDLVMDALKEGSSEMKLRDSIVINFRGMPHKPVAVKPEISPLFESSRESSGSREATSQVLKFQFGDDLLQQHEPTEEAGAAAAATSISGAQPAEPATESFEIKVVPTGASVELESKPALPDPIDLGTMMPQLSSSKPAEAEPVRPPSGGRRSRGLPRQAGIVHFVDNLVNQASEESRLQLQRAERRHSEGRALETGGQHAAAVNLSLDLDLERMSEAAPMAPLGDEIHYTSGQEDGTVIKTHRIELREESPMKPLPYSAEGEYFNTNMPEMSQDEPQPSTSSGLGAAARSLDVPRFKIRKKKAANRHAGATAVDRSAEAANQPRMAAQEVEDEKGRIPVQAYIAINELSDDLVVKALGEAYSIMGIMQAGEVDQENGERERKFVRKVEYFVEGLLHAVFRGAMRSAAKELYKMVQTPSTMCSSEENLVMSYEMYVYVEDFVQDVMQDAIDMYRRQYVPAELNRKRKSVEEIWIRPQSDGDSSDGEFFRSEFSHKSPSVKSYASDRSFKVKRGLPDTVAFRRGSLDEVAQYRNSRRRESALGFKNSLLSDFEIELAKGSTLRQSPKMLYFDHGQSAASKRRASEPATGHSFVEFHNHLENLAKHRRSYSSLDLMSSREMILDWLDDCSHSSNVSLTQHHKRKRTTSSHLDWFAQDLLVDVFTDAFTEIFGPNYPAYHECLQQRSNSILSVEDLESLKSSHIPSNAHSEHIPSTLNKYASYLSVSILKSAVDEALNHERRSLSTEAPSSEYYDAPDLPYSQLEMIADSFSWKIIEEARSVVRKGLHLENMVPRDLRPIATGNWGSGRKCGNAQLKALLQWAAASRTGAPHVIYFTYGQTDMSQFDSIAKYFLQERYTIGQMLRLVVEYCHIHGGLGRMSLFQYIREPDAGD